MKKSQPSSQKNAVSEKSNTSSLTTGKNDVNDTTAGDKEKSSKATTFSVKTTSSAKNMLSRNLALKLSNDIKDSALLSSIQLFEDQRTNTPPSGAAVSSSSNSQSSGEFGAVNALALTSNRVTTTTTTTTMTTMTTMMAASKGLSVSANSKSLSSLLLLNTTGNFSYDGSTSTNSPATTPTPLSEVASRSIGARSNCAYVAARFKLIRSESINAAENDDFDDNPDYYFDRYISI